MQIHKLFKAHLRDPLKTFVQNLSHYLKTVVRTGQRTDDDDDDDDDDNGGSDNRAIHHAEISLNNLSHSSSGRVTSTLKSTRPH